jgi:aspartyl-tRNA(Asn)/glutamyl-tRNA(Gln) amidotransferase subunit B
LDYDICNYAKKKNNAFAKYIDSETVPMRDKEIKQDYRFMPEPNLPPLCLFDNESISTTSCDTSIINIDDIRTKLPPLPEEIRQRLEKNYNIPRQNAALLTVGIRAFNIFQVYQYFTNYRRSLFFLN